MKRMNEIFELPIDTVAAFTYGFNTIAEAHKIGRCLSAKHAASASTWLIALADALESLSPQVGKVYSTSKELGNAEDVASAALAAYRGAK